MEGTHIIEIGAACALSEGQRNNDARVVCYLDVPILCTGPKTPVDYVDSSPNQMCDRIGNAHGTEQQHVPVGSGPRTRSARCCDGAQQLPPVPASMPVRAVDDEWGPPDGCGIQRTPGVNPTVGKQITNISPGGCRHRTCPSRGSDRVNVPKRQW